MTDADLYAPILALRRRLAELEKQAAAQAPPTLTDRTPTFGDAINALRTTGSASGSAVDRLREAVTGPRPTTTTPDPASLAAATQRVAGDLTGSASIEDAFRVMKTNAANRDAVENVQPGGLGWVDTLDPANAGPLATLRRVLEEGH
jgi:hypothetical protein